MENGGRVAEFVGGEVGDRLAGEVGNRHADSQRVDQRADHDVLALLRGVRMNVIDVQRWWFMVSRQKRWSSYSVTVLARHVLQVAPTSNSSRESGRRGRTLPCDCLVGGEVVVFSSLIVWLVFLGLVT